ncbi:MAG: hypothetical protein ABH832_01000 [bacterium]
MIDWLTNKDKLAEWEELIGEDWEDIEQRIVKGEVEDAMSEIEHVMADKYGVKFIVGSHNNEYTLISGGDGSYHSDIAKYYLQEHGGDLHIFGGGVISVNHVCGTIRFYGASGSFGYFDHILVKKFARLLTKELEGTWLEGYLTIVDPPSTAHYK